MTSNKTPREWFLYNAMDEARTVLDAHPEQLPHPPYILPVCKVREITPEEVSDEAMLEWVKRAQIAERKVEKLKQLLLLTDPSVSNTIVTDLTIIQFNEFIKEFPDEPPSREEQK